MSPSRSEFALSLAGAAAGLKTGRASRMEERSKSRVRGSLTGFHAHMFGIGTGRTGCTISDCREAASAY